MKTATLGQVEKYLSLIRGTPSTQVQNALEGGGIASVIQNAAPILSEGSDHAQKYRPKTYDFFLTLSCEERVFIYTIFEVSGSFSRTTLTCSAKKESSQRDYEFSRSLANATAAGGGVLRFRPYTLDFIEVYLGENPAATKEEVVVHILKAFFRID